MLTQQFVGTVTLVWVMARKNCRRVNAFTRQLANSWIRIQLAMVQFAGQLALYSGGQGRITMRRGRRGFRLLSFGFVWL